MTTKPPRLRGLLIATLGLLLTACHSTAPHITLSVGSPPQGPQGPAGVAFWILGALTVIGAVFTITRRNPVVAAVGLVGTLLASAGIYLLMQASFMAIIQVLVYAGAIMVLFVLVVMSVDHPEHEELGLLRGTLAKVVGVVAIGWLLFRVAVVVLDLPPELRRPAEGIADDFGQVSSTVREPSSPPAAPSASIARLLFSDYLFPFEAISVLLLTAVVGAVVVTRRRTNEGEDPAGDAATRGRAA